MGVVPTASSVSEVSVAKPVEIGTKFHRWEVIGFDANPLYLQCRCECGTERRVNKKNLKAGLSKSCSCLDQEQHTTHGMSNTRTYRRWQQMKDRVRLNIYYIENGITICERWLGPPGFANFLADMGECPPDKKSLDRHPDPAGNYEPGNCRWATDSEQQRGKTTTRFYTHDGKTQSAAAWAEQHGLILNTLLGRLDRGWTFERAITTPQAPRRGRGTPQTKDQLIEYKGGEQTLAQWAVEFGLNITTMIERVWKKWPMEKIERTPQGSQGGYTKAKGRNELLRNDPSLTLVDGDVLKYLTDSEVVEVITALVASASTVQREAIMNAVCGGAHPIARLPGCPATRFAVRPDDV